jgi:two-component sensor histidine kinase
MTRLKWAHPYPTLSWSDWRMWALVTAVLVAVAVVHSLHQALVLWWIGETVTFQKTIGKYILAWLLRVPFVPLVWLLADRFRLDRRNWRLSASVHLIASVILADVHLVLSLWVRPFFQPLLGYVDTPLTFSSSMLTFFPHNFLWYWSVVGIFYVLHYHSEALEKMVIAAHLQGDLMLARLQTLRGQLNPHFLFNTLNTISTLSLKGDTEAVDKVLQDLSSLLRIALDDARPDNISLKSELEFVDGYLDIQKIRFSNRLSIQRDLEPEALTGLVPAMILAPIVENAVEHGVYSAEGHTTISIRASRDNGFLRLQVNDNGPGFRGGVPSSKRIGLTNTEERLERLYGSAQRIEYGKAESGGASVTITIPFSPSGDGVASVR